MRHRLTVSSIRACVLTAACAAAVLANGPALGADKDPSGQDLAKDFCQACHYFQGSEQAGTAGPPLVAMKSRFKDPKALYDIIYDPHAAIAHDSMMPPFGRNGLLTSDEIHRLMDYLYSL